LVLASDEDGGTLEALKFSLASDIVELLVLTTDGVFLQTLRDAVGGARRLWHVLSADKVSDLLVAGEVGIVVLDAQALHEAASVFVGQIKRQFPDLVVVAAGHRDDETSLAGLISAGMVYRFIHKPMSPARAKLFAEAAIRKYEDQRRRAAEAPRRKPAPPSGRNRLAGVAIGALGLTAVAAWMVHRSGGEEAVAPPAVETAKAASTDSSQLARNPADSSDGAGLAEVRERLLARAENALLEERLDEAAAAIETARKSGIEGDRIAFLTAQLAKSRERTKMAQAQIQQRYRARTEPKAGEDRVTSSLNLAAQRIAEGLPIEPDRDGADGIAVPANIEKNIEPVPGLLAAARKQADVDAAKSLPDEAGAIGFTSAEVSSAQHLDAAPAKQNFMTNLVPANQLTLLKSVQPVYPSKAEAKKIQGWVDVEFTVLETGKVKDVAVRAASIPGVFEDAAVKAVSQWRYQPILRDARTVPVRTQIRVRFTLS
jgi:TonB family protein